MAAGVGAALLGVAGCGPGGLAGDESGDAAGETSTAKPSGEVLAGVDPCNMLSESELKSSGLQGPGEKADTLSWREGCNYDGDPASLTLLKDTRQTVDSAEKKDTWAKFERTEVNGRAAATAVTEGSTQAQICNVMFDAGQGLIQIQAQEAGRSDSLDECAKALEIAKKVEPNVPEPA
ncbi:DUF3558 domain-containing protein [Actinopolyspora saharensis]|uniref:DUF3558 domain-containing protein n=1 Tax=Actinopolyspora saharensis TaxID=995062 RepID=UPI000B89B2EC|nr:DUF3558 domain-containing protein [Actinopolyspora saharensis]